MKVTLTMLELLSGVQLLVVEDQYSPVTSSPSDEALHSAGATSCARVAHPAARWSRHGTAEREIPAARHWRVSSWGWVERRVTLSVQLRPVVNTRVVSELEAEAEMPSALPAA